MECLESNKAKVFPCDLCGKIFSTKAKVLDHKGSYQCDVCFKTIHNKKNVKRHKENLHAASLGVQCDICLKHILKSQNLKRHIKSCREKQDKFDCTKFQLVKTLCMSMKRNLKITLLKNIFVIIVSVHTKLAIA